MERPPNFWSKLPIIGSLGTVLLDFICLGTLLLPMVETDATPAILRSPQRTHTQSEEVPVLKTLLEYIRLI